MDVGQQIVIAVSLVLVVWYLVFSFVNRKRGIAVYHWLREGVETLGPLADAGWVGSAASGGRMAVTKALPPFQRVELIFLLQSREILPLWLFNLGRNKRDELILKAWLRRPPLQQVEAGFKDSPLVGYRPAEKAGGLAVAVKGEGAAPGKTLRAFLERYGEHIVSFSLQRGKPHLIIRLRLESGLDAAPSAEFFRDLQRIFS